MYRDTKAPKHSKKKIKHDNNKKKLNTTNIPVAIVASLHFKLFFSIRHWTWVSSVDFACSL